MRSAWLFLAGILLFTIFASPAEARRFRMIPIPGFGGGGDTIDLVYDLPNEPPFVRDGQGIDVGYLHSSKGNAYVLYQGDRYTKLGDAEIAMLTGVLGFDPTAKHRADYARTAPQKERPNVVERRAGESAEEFEARKKAFIEAHRSAMAERAASRPTQDAAARPTPPTTAGRTPGWISALSIVVFVVILLSVAWKLRHRILPAKGAVDKDESMEASYASVDAHIADRLSELQRDAVPQASGSRSMGRLSPASSFAANTPVRAFGRRNA